MHFTIDQKDRVTIFKLNEARLDSLNVGQLKAEFLILAQPDVEVLIVDLSQVSYIDSAGLSALLLAERQQTAHGGDVRLVGVHENVKSLLRITQLDRIFPMYATVNEAIQADLTGMSDQSDPTHLGPGAPSKDAIRTGAIAAGGSLGAAALAGLIMNPTMLQGDEEDDYDDEDEDDDFDDLDELDDPDVAEVAEGDIAVTETVIETDDDFDDDDEDAYSDDDLDGDLADEDDDLDDEDEDDEEDV